MVDPYATGAYQDPYAQQAAPAADAYYQDFWNYAGWRRAASHGSSARVARALPWKAKWTPTPRDALAPRYGEAAARQTYGAYSPPPGSKPPAPPAPEGPDAFDEWTYVYTIKYTLDKPADIGDRRVLVEVDCRDHDCNAAIHNIFLEVAH